MTKRVLILGYGRAGKRWANICLRREYDVCCYDPAITEYPWRVSPLANFDDSLPAIADFAIIATPPNKHLDSIETLFNIGITDVLCEKPLCSIGEMERAKELLGNEHVMVAYNYFYHPSMQIPSTPADFHELNCSQHRNQIPEWGLLLDHCSHDLDIARLFLGNDLRVTYAHHQVSSGIERWSIGLVTNQDQYSQNFFIDEAVYLARKVERIAALRYWDTGSVIVSTIQLDPNPKMFEDMLDAFLDGTRNSEDALITQQLIEEAYAKANLESST
jgi:predicted dehydrogenase